jgi:hypothetical protein
VPDELKTTVNVPQCPDGSYLTSAGSCMTLESITVSPVTHIDVTAPAYAQFGIFVLLVLVLTGAVLWGIRKT